MRLQLTLDVPNVEDCLDLVYATQDVVDVVEVGYPLLVEEGLSLVCHVKHAFPDKLVLADAKIFHSGGYVARTCFSYGADAVSVLGVASDETFRAVCRVADGCGGTVIADLAGAGKAAARARELVALGVNAFVVPSGLSRVSDERSLVSDRGEGGDAAPLSDLHDLRELLPQAEVGVVGNVNADTIDRVVAEKPSVILVGRAIVSAKDPHEAALKLKRRMGA